MEYQTWDTVQARPYLLFGWHKSSRLVRCPHLFRPQVELSVGAAHPILHAADKAFELELPRAKAARHGVMFKYPPRCLLGAQYLEA